MARIINSNNQSELPFASDIECEVYRSSLMVAGAITPCDESEIITKKDGEQVVSTREKSKTQRNRLIERGIIQPRPSYESIPKLPRESRNIEEGSYSPPKNITSEMEYKRRRDVYLWLISDILHTRKDLRLALDRKNNDDPDWYF